MYVLLPKILHRKSTEGGVVGFRNERMRKGGLSADLWDNRCNYCSFTLSTQHFAPEVDRSRSGRFQKKKNEKTRLVCFPKQHTSCVLCTTQYVCTLYFTRQHNLKACALQLDECKSFHICTKIVPETPLQDFWVVLILSRIWKHKSGFHNLLLPHNPRPLEKYFFLQIYIF